MLVRDFPNKRIKGLLERIKNGLGWRYQQFVEPTIDLYGDIPSFVKYQYQLKTKVLKHKAVYIYANRRNIGDYISHLGVREITGIQGGELYCSKGGHKDLLAYLERCREKGVVALIGGGGLFQPAFELFWNSLLASKVEFALIGVGVNQMAGRPLLPRELLSKVVQRAESIHVRDNFTLEYLQTLNEAEITLGVCPSVNFINRSTHGQKGDSTNTLLHVVHPSDLRMSGVSVERLRENLRQFCKEEGFCYRESDNMGTNVTKAIKDIRSAALVVSSRLHGCIMSYASNTPFVPLYCDKKTEYFVDSHTDKKGYEAVQFQDMKFTRGVLKKELTEISSYSNVQGVLQRKIKENYDFGESLRAKFF
ncbi:MAG: hypothetical protein CME81_00040 [Halomonas sp.]|nr:hypothetical protein [Halomonas sp.]